MQITAAVVESQGAPFALEQLELGELRPDELLVRVAAAGVCHTDLIVRDQWYPVPLPAVLGHEGAGIVEAVGPGVTRVRPGQRVALSWAPSCGTCEECLRDLTHLCSEAKPAMGTGGLMDSTTRLSRDGEPVYHYSFLSTFADHAVVPERSLIPIAEDVPFDVAGLVGCAVTTGIGAVWFSARVRPGERVAVIGCGGVGLSAIMGAVAVGAAPIVAVDVSQEKLEAALSFGATDAVLADRDPDVTAERVREVSGGGVDYAIEATGRPDASRAAFLSTRTRGTAVLIGIPREDAVVELPALSIPRMERRVMGSLYGSSRPERDFAVILDQYRRGRLPLDRLISHRLPLEEIEQAFELLTSGTSLRTVLDLS
jgi:Zn-dependent alcohol dehydrogenase